MSDEVFISHFPAAYLRKQVRQPSKVKMGSNSLGSETVLQALNQVVDHPDEFNDRAPEITSLAHRAVAALETPFEAFQRLAYSVGQHPPSTGPIADIRIGAPTSSRTNCSTATDLKGTCRKHGN